MSFSKDETAALTSAVATVERLFDTETTAITKERSRKLLPERLARRDEYQGLLRTLRPLLPEEKKSPAPAAAEKK